MRIGHGPATVIGETPLVRTPSQAVAAGTLREKGWGLMRLVFLAGLFLFLSALARVMTLNSKLRAPNEVASDFPEHRLGTNSLWLAVLLLILCGAVFAGQTGGALPRSREITDEFGRKVQVPQIVDRVVSLAPNLTEIVFALGEGKQLAGDTDYCDYPPEALQKPHVGGTVNPNLEEIVALMPDLVLATKSINRRETVDALDRIGVPVYVTEDPHSVGEMINSVEHLGSAMGAEKSAAAVVEDLRSRLADLDHRLAAAQPRRVLFVVWTDPLISVGRGTFIADALRLAGGRSVVETKAEWPHISLEEIVRLQPEVLVFASGHAGDTQREIDALRTRAGWRSLDAMQHDKIVVVSDAIDRPAPRMVDAIEHLAHALHPEAFASRTAPSADYHLNIEEACACAR